MLYLILLVKLRYSLGLPPERSLPMLLPLLCPLSLHISSIRRGRWPLQHSCPICFTLAGRGLCNDSLLLQVSLSVLSILYKTKLPFVLVFNKTDVQPHEFAIEWMKDFEAFQRALSEHGSQRTGGSRSGDGEPNYMDSLMNSMSLVLDEFYNHLTVSCSSLGVQ